MPDDGGPCRGLERLAGRSWNDPFIPTLQTAPMTGGASASMSAGQIGPYRLLRVLGEGGMGQVWLAEQKTPIQRTVALKVIKAGMDTRAVVARFESERQALALMDHPNIAQVFEASSTPEGRPYFVMEYVQGLPITEYCDKHRLSMKDRLQLFMQVCEGVQHAHQKAIIHRDLKPSNVLVVQQNDKAIPKIIDFGLAKAMAQRLTANTVITELGVLVGTPEYMSPEQTDLRVQDIDTRTDVYSLGVILYELLVGALPFDTRALRTAGLEAILRTIREETPPKPSTKVRLMGASSAVSAGKRNEEPRTLARRLQGDLDWITLKALEKDRGRRYATASEFAADLQRYLRNEAVVAGPASATYRLRKYAVRHRFGLGAAALVAILLIAFAATQTIQLRRIQRERDRANRVTDFMTQMFKVVDPNEARGNTITAREVLDKASRDIDAGLAQDPELQAQLLHTMGNVHIEPRAVFHRGETVQSHDRHSAERPRRQPHRHAEVDGKAGADAVSPRQIRGRRGPRARDPRCRAATIRDGSSDDAGGSDRSRVDSAGARKARRGRARGSRGHRDRAACPRTRCAADAGGDEQPGDGVAAARALSRSGAGIPPGVPRLASGCWERMIRTL